LVKHIGPKKAAEVSGYTLEIDKTEAKAATDYMKAVTAAQKAEASNIGTDAFLLDQIIAESQVPGNFEAAVERLASMWVGGGLDVNDIYTGYSGPKTFKEMREYARDMLGKQSGNSASDPSNAEVSGTKLISP
jgi:hypothetical protein